MKKIRTKTKKVETKKTAPPSATGPHGALLEGAVAGFYLLSLLAKGEARGLLGATATRVAFQQASFGSPLDDVVVHAANNDGSPATLEIQVKSKIAFTASDTEFADVVDRMWQSSEKAEFSATRYELAVAIGKTTTRIEAEYQEVIKWARESPSAAEFAKRIGKKSFASDGMRAFVEVFRGNLKKIKAPHDNDAVWRLLRRFQILVFDFESPGSDFEHRAKERCRILLKPEEAARGAELWEALTKKAMRSSATAGGFDYAGLVKRLNDESGFAFALPPDLRFAHMRLQEQASDALRGVKTTVGGEHLSRQNLQALVESAAEKNRVVALVGAPGSGKSAILKHNAELRAAEGTTVVLSRGRISAGGWTQWANDYKIALSREDFFNELGCGGGNILCVDNLDQIDDPDHISTVSDLLSAVLASPGWQVLFTASAVRPELLERFPALVTPSIAEVDVPELSDEEVLQLSESNSELGSLLRPGHPAQRLARNLFYLSRLLELAPTTDFSKTPITTESALAKVWWKFGGGRDEKEKLARLKLLRAMSAQMIAAPTKVSVRADTLEASTVEALLQLDVLREHQPGFSVAFRHDVLRDWSLGFLLHEDSKQLEQLKLSAPIPESLARPLEFAARLALDADETGKEWTKRLGAVSQSGAHGSWRRPVLLALTRPEHAFTVLENLQPLILADNGKLLCELIRLMLSVESRPLSEVLARAQPTMTLPSGLEAYVVPNSEGWLWLLMWIVKHASELSPAVIPDVSRLFLNFLMLGAAQAPPLSTAIVNVIFGWLVRADKALAPRMYKSYEEIEDLDFTFAHMESTREELRFGFANFCQFTPELAELYLKGLGDDVQFQDIQWLLKNQGSLARTAPAAYVDFALSKLAPDGDDEDPYASRNDYSPSSAYDSEFRAPSPSQGAFFDLLENAPAEGLRLVRGIVEYATRWFYAKFPADQPKPSIKISFPEGERAFVGGGRVYGWARSAMPSAITTCALMALEAWGHQQLEKGRPFAEVFADILGPNGSSAAFLAVAVDLVLSHWKQAKGSAWPLLGSPELLRFDQWRREHDQGQSLQLNPFRKPEQDYVPYKRASLDAKPSRDMRLIDQIANLLSDEDQETREALRKTLEAQNKRLASSGDDEPIDGLKAIGKRAWRMTDPTNWSIVQVPRGDGSSASGIQYRPDEEEISAIKAQQAATQSGFDDMTSRISIDNALLNANALEPSQLEDFLEWAKAKQADLGQTEKPSDQDGAFTFECDQRAVVMVAALAVRDSAGATRDDNRSWALPILRAAATETKSETFDPHLRYSAKALGYLGLLLAYAQNPDVATRNQLVDLTADLSDAMRNALDLRLKDLMLGSPDLARALLRVAFAGSIHVRSYGVKDRKAEKKKLVEETAARQQSEKDWLDGKREEPEWPDLPLWQTRPKRGIQIGSSREKTRPKDVEPPERVVNEHAIGGLMNLLVPLTTGSLPDWLLPLAEKLLAWTIDANGLTQDDPDGRPHSLNAAFFDFLGVLSVALPSTEVLAKFVSQMQAMGNDAFCDAAAAFVRGFDRATFASDTKKSDNPIAIRSALAERLKSTHFFRWRAKEKSTSMERHVADAVAALFFHQSSLQWTRYASVPANWPDLGSAMEPLIALVEAAPASQYIATAFLNLMQTSHAPELLPTFAKALQCWVKEYGPDPAIWVDGPLGVRVCKWLDAALRDSRLQSDALETVHASLFESLDCMIQAGLGQAKATEDALTKRRGPA